MHHVSCSFLAKHWITQMTQCCHSPDLVPCNFLLFPIPKPPLNGKRFQIINKTQENTPGQLMAIGRTMWGPKVPTLMGIKLSLSYVQCFLYLVSPSINVSTFNITWQDTFWTDFICVILYMCIDIIFGDICICVQLMLYIDTILADIWKINNQNIQSNYF